MTQSDFHADRAARGYCAIPDAILCPNHPQVCIGTDLWKGECPVCGTTCGQASLIWAGEKMLATMEAHQAIEQLLARPLAFRVALGTLEVSTFLAARMVLRLYEVPYWSRRAATALFRRTFKSKEST